MSTAPGAPLDNLVGAVFGRPRLESGFLIPAQLLRIHAAQLAESGAGETRPSPHCLRVGSCQATPGTLGLARAVARAYAETPELASPSGSCARLA
jgi:hypothetical protein